MDYGYDYSMDQGRAYVEKTLGVPTMSQENIPESADVTRVMEKMIRAAHAALRDSLVVFVAICMRRGTASGAPAGLRAVLDG